VAQPTLEELQRELELNLGVIKNEEGKIFSTFRAADVSKEKDLVKSLAAKIAVILREMFDKLFSTVKTQPLTSDQEWELSDLASRLQEAYTLSEQDELAQEAGEEALQADFRASEKEKQAAALVSLGNQIDALKEWTKTPRYEGVRALPILNSFLWTTPQAKLAIAQERVRLVKQEMDQVRPYPVLLAEQMEKLIEAKMELLALQTPDTKEYLANKREIAELSKNLQKIDKVQIAKNKIKQAEAAVQEAAISTDPATYKSQMRDKLQVLIKAKEALAAEMPPAERGALLSQIEGFKQIVQTM
jgi:hypothetical protein